MARRQQEGGDYPRPEFTQRKNTDLCHDRARWHRGIVPDPDKGCNQGNERQDDGELQFVLLRANLMSLP